jgi:hypothetical protein
MRERYEKRDLFFEAAAVHASMPDGSTVPADEYTAAVLEVTANTLLMFGHEHDWYDADGFLVLPARVAVDVDTLNLAGSTMELGAIWGQLAHFETRWRYFGGDVDLVNADDASELRAHAVRGAAADDVPVREAGEPARAGSNIASGDRRPDAMQILRFQHEHGVELTFLVAEARLRNMMLQTYFRITNETRYEHLLSASERTELPPKQFVDAEELAAALTLSDLFGFLITDDENEHFGLRIAEWLRGYSALRRLPTNEEQTPSNVHRVSKEELVGHLGRFGLPSEKALRFANATQFGRHAVDLYDAPFIADADGWLYFVPKVLSNTSNVHTVLSQVSSSPQLGKKGHAFERCTRQLLEQHGIKCARLHFRRDDEEFECDCAFVLDETLFLVEAKTHALPGARAERRFHFFDSMVDAADQVQRIAAAIAADPSPVTDALGPVAWTRVERLVLNSMPWSIPTDDGTVAYYDYSALSRLLDSPYLHLKTTTARDNKGLVVARRARQLRDETGLTAIDLLREARFPFQVRALAAAYAQHERFLPITDGYAVLGSTTIPTPLSLSQQLEALGIDHAARAVSDIEELVHRLRRAEK